MAGTLILDGPTTSGPMPPLDPSTLRAFESRIGRRLPAAYRRMLLAQNGGIPRPRSYTLPGAPDLGTSWVDYLVGIDDPRSGLPDRFHSYFMAFQHRKYEPILPDDCLVIGIASRDNPFLLFVRGERSGHIYEKVVGETGFHLVDSDPEQDKILGLRFVAKSFAGFVKMLHEEESA